MKNLVKIYLVIIVGGLFFVTSCFEADDPLYKDAGGGDSYLQFTAINSTTAMTPADVNSFELPFGVKILGDPASSDMTVTLELMSGTTVNTDTQVVISSTSILINTGKVQGNAYLTVYPNAFELSPDTLKLKLKIIDGSAKIASYGGMVTFNFVYNVCPFDILDYLGGFTCNEEGYGEYDVSFTLDPDVENRTHNSNFWDWAAPGATVYYDFSGDENQVIIIPDQPFTFGDGVVGSVDGTGTYDACTGKFSCDYNVWYGGDNNPTHHDFYRPGTMKSASIVALKKPAFLKSN